MFRSHLRVFCLLVQTLTLKGFGGSKDRFECWLFPVPILNPHIDNAMYTKKEIICASSVNELVCNICVFPPTC